MKRMLWMCALGLAISGSVTAQVVADSALPPSELVLQAIELTPEVRAAEAALSRAEAEQRMRQVGPYEAQLSVIPQQRRIQDGRNYPEWELDLTRSVRLPGKRRLDREIGATGREAAQLMLEDAHHSGARQLLASWTAWQRAGVAAEVQRRQVAFWQRDRVALARRVALGDAAQRELVALDAALAQARAAAQQAELDQQAAGLLLNSRYPGLPLPETIRLSSKPEALPGSDAYWTALILARSHEIGAADALSRQKDAEARRARANRLPDPNIGLRALSDRGGRERVLGLTLSIPLGVSYRGAQSAAAAADAMAAQAQLAMVSRDVRLDAQRVVAMARGLYALWQRQREASAASEASADKTARAYALGESGLAELLAARRLALDALLAEQRARLDAIEAVTRVEVDAHELWHRHDDEHDAGHDGTTATTGIALPALGP